MLYQVANFQFGGIGGEPRDCYALGYTLFAYLSNYREDPSGGVTEKLKMLSYNGVAPTEESLKDGSYLLTDGYYAVLRKDTRRMPRPESCSPGFRAIQPLQSYAARAFFPLHKHGIYS